MNLLRNHKVSVAIFALALVARLFYLGLSIHADNGQLANAISGSDCYFAIAQNIVAGNGYSCDSSAPYTLDSMRPPVQPYFIAVVYSIFHTYWAPLLLQIILGSIIPLLGMMIAGYLTKRRRLVIGLGVILAIEPVSILFSTFFYSETVFTFLLLLSVLCIFKYVREQKTAFLALSGALLG